MGVEEEPMRDRGGIVMRAKRALRNDVLDAPTMDLALCVHRSRHITGVTGAVSARHVPFLSAWSNMVHDWSMIGYAWVPGWFDNDY